MAPFRASRATRSGRPGNPTEDNFFLDGLPIRQWRMQETTLGTPDLYSSTSGNVMDSNVQGLGANELPMPKGSHLYSHWCQQLLRATRAGKLYRPQINNWSASNSHPSVRQEDKDNDSEDNGPNAAERKQSVTSSEGFRAKRWTQVLRDMEEPEREFLAKKRKGLASAFPTHAVNGADPGAMRKTKVRKVDSEGTATIFEVLIPQGQVLEGEVKDGAILESSGGNVEAPPAGTIVEGVGIANQDGVVIASSMAEVHVRSRSPRSRKRSKKAIAKKKKNLALTDGAGQGVSASAEAFAARNAAKQSTTDVDNQQSKDTEMENAPTQLENDEDDEDDDDDIDVDGEAEDDVDVGEEGEAEADGDLEMEIDMNHQAPSKVDKPGESGAGILEPINTETKQLLSAEKEELSKEPLITDIPFTASLPSSSNEAKPLESAPVASILPSSSAIPEIPVDAKVSLPTPDDKEENVNKYEPTTPPVSADTLQPPLQASLPVPVEPTVLPTIQPVVESSMEPTINSIVEPAPEENAESSMTKIPQPATATPEPTTSNMDVTQEKSEILHEPSKEATLNGGLDLLSTLQKHIEEQAEQTRAGHEEQPQDSTAPPT